MPPRRILVTGATGFVGRHLLPVLREEFADAEVIGSSANGGGGTARLDVTDREQVARTVADVAPEGCVHLAGLSTIAAARSDPDRAWRINLHGTLAVARAILAQAPDCRFVFASTAEVYGRTFRAGAALDESAMLAPLNTYAATKAAADLAVGALAGEGLRAVRLRPANHTGPGQTANFVVPAFARQIARIAQGRQPPVIEVGSLEPWRDFLDVRDVCAAYAACLRADALDAGQIVNLASGTPRRIGDVLDDLMAIAGVAARVASQDALRRPKEIPLAAVDAGLARTLLGWRPRIAWSTTLADVLEDWAGRAGGSGP